MNSSYNLSVFLVPCVKDQNELSYAVLPNAFGKLHRLTFSRHGRLTVRQVLIYPCCGWVTLKFMGTVTKVIELGCRQNRFLIQHWKRPDLTHSQRARKCKQVQLLLRSSTLSNKTMCFSIMWDGGTCGRLLMGVFMHASGSFSSASEGSPSTDSKRYSSLILSCTPHSISRGMMPPQKQSWISPGFLVESLIQVKTHIIWVPCSTHEICHIYNFIPLSSILMWLYTSVTSWSGYFYCSFVK